MGKSSLSYALARHFGMAITEVDDLFIAVETLTAPAQQPNIHYWKEHPEAAVRLPAEGVLEIHLEICRALSPAIVAVINNHTDTETPVVLDGDYILPELIVECANTAKGLFVVENDMDQIVQNYVLREPHAGDQKHRAEVSWLFGRWLVDECRDLGLPVISSRPWDTVLERALLALSG